MPGFETFAQVRDAKRNLDVLKADFYKIGASQDLLTFSSQWASGIYPAAGAHPAGAVSYTNTAGGIVLPDLAPQKKYLARIDQHSLQATAINWLVDRLTAYGGIAATGVGAKASVTPVLPRYTNGRGVIGIIEVQSQTLTASRTITVSYTNELGVAGRVSASIVLPTSSGTGLLQRVFFIPLQSGDLGIRSIEAVNVVAESGGGTSTINVVLLRTLAALTGPDSGGSVGAGDMRWIVGTDFFAERGLVEVLDGATLQFVTQNPAVNGSAGSVVRGRLVFFYR